MLPSSFPLPKNQKKGKKFIKNREGLGEHKQDGKGIGWFISISNYGTHSPTVPSTTPPNPRKGEKKRKKKQRLELT